MDKSRFCCGVLVPTAADGKKTARMNPETGLETLSNKLKRLLVKLIETPRVGISPDIPEISLYLHSERDQIYRTK
jgi:hypothetical protein